MSKKAFDDIKAGLEDGIAFARGDTTRGVLHVAVVPEWVDVKAIRAGFGMSQRKFADQFGFEPRTVQDWEQGRRNPDRTARILMKVIERAPDVVMAALSADGPRARGVTPDAAVAAKHKRRA